MKDLERLPLKKNYSTKSDSELLDDWVIVPEKEDKEKDPFLDSD
jgi:hypothetical protein